MFQNSKPARWISPTCFEKKSPSDELFLHFSSKVQNLTMFSIIYMIRILFFRSGELIQNGFRRTRYTQSGSWPRWCKPTWSEMSGGRITEGVGSSSAGAGTFWTERRLGSRGSMVGPSWHGCWHEYEPSQTQRGRRLSSKTRAREVTSEHKKPWSLVLVRYIDDTGWSHERITCNPVDGDGWVTHSHGRDMNEERLEDYEGLELLTGLAKYSMWWEAVVDLIVRGRVSGDIDSGGGVEVRRSRHRAGYLVDIVDGRLDREPDRDTNILGSVSSEDNGAIWYLFGALVDLRVGTEMRLRVSISPSGVEPLGMSVERRWHSVGSPWRVGAWRVHRMLKNRTTLPVGCLGESLPVSADATADGEVDEDIRTLFVDFDDQQNRPVQAWGSTCSLPGHVWTPERHGGHPQLWYAEWSCGLNLSKRDRFFHEVGVPVESLGVAGTNDQLKLNSMMCLEVVKRSLWQVLGTTAGVWDVSDSVPSELCAFSRRMEREEHCPEGWIGNTRNPTLAWAATGTGTSQSWWEREALWKRLWARASQDEHAGGQRGSCSGIMSLS